MCKLALHLLTNLLPKRTTSHSPNLFSRAMGHAKLNLLWTCYYWILGSSLLDEPFPFWTLNELFHRCQSQVTRRARWFVTQNHLSSHHWKLFGKGQFFFIIFVSMCHHGSKPYCDPQAHVITPILIGKFHVG